MDHEFCTVVNPVQDQAKLKLGVRLTPQNVAEPYTPWLECKQVCWMRWLHEDLGWRRNAGLKRVIFNNDMAHLDGM